MIGLFNIKAYWGYVSAPRITLVNKSKCLNVFQYHQPILMFKYLDLMLNVPTQIVFPTLTLANIGVQRWDTVRPSGRSAYASEP